MLKRERKRLANLSMQKATDTGFNPQRLLKDLMWIGIRLLRLRVLMSVTILKSLPPVVCFLSFLNEFRKHSFIYGRFSNQCSHDKCVYAVKY